MTENQVVGMFVGLFVGDALGAPYEFLPSRSIPQNINMTTGGIHDVTLGEYTDDGAMALAIASSYLTHKQFDPATIANNFKAWKYNGEYSTRNYVFDIGNTCSKSISRMTTTHPYASQCDTKSSGNGSLMRIAPIIAANHNNPMQALSETIAVSLMTHGSKQIIDYTTAFVDELFRGKLEQYEHLRYSANAIENAKSGHGSIMYAYNAAWYACHYGAGDFEDALVCAIKLGHDTDTNAAITGMLMGARCGFDAIPNKWLKHLQNREHIIDVAKQLYQIGANRTVSVPA